MSEDVVEVTGDKGAQMLVVSGLRNKQIAAELGSSEVTITIHRGQVMRKMRAQSIVELVHMAEKIGMSSTGSSHTKILWNPTRV